MGAGITEEVRRWLAQEQGWGTCEGSVMAQKRRRSQLSAFCPRQMWSQEKLRSEVTLSACDKDTRRLRARAVLRARHGCCSQQWLWLHTTAVVAREVWPGHLLKHTKHPHVRITGPTSSVNRVRGPSGAQGEEWCERTQPGEVCSDRPTSHRNHGAVAV